MYKQVILNHFIDYLKAKKISYKRSGKVITFDCPFCDNPECKINLIPNSTNSHSFICKTDATFIDIYKKIENCPELSDEEVLYNLKNLLDINVTTDTDIVKLEELLKTYQTLGFDLVPIIKDGKRPVEKEWTTKNHKNIEEWKDWIINGGLNIGVKTGSISGILVIDFDVLSPQEAETLYKEKSEEEVRVVIDSRLPKFVKDYAEYYMVQYTRKGYHLFFKYDPDFPKTRVEFDTYAVDIETDGGQVVIAPSEVDGHKRYILNTNIEEMPAELKELLKANATVPRKTYSEKIKEDIQSEDFKIEMFKEGERNASLVRLGGIFRKELNPSQTRFVLNVLNNHNINPLSRKEVEAMAESLERYDTFDEQELAHEILKYLKEVKSSTKSDIELVVAGEFTKGESKKRVNKALQYLLKEDKIRQKGSAKKIYEVIEDLDWKDTLIDVGVPINFKLPFFHDYAFFNWGDIIVIASKTKYGKTHLSMNIVNRLVQSGIKPYYLYSETGGRFSKIALHLGMREGQFHHAFISDPRKIILPKKQNSVIVYDWLRPPDFAKTDNLFSDIVEKIQKINGVMIIFMQLKSNNDYFAENLLAQYPAFVCKYVYENDNDGTYTKFHVTEIRDGKTQQKKFDIPCIYNWESKQVKMVEELSEAERNNLTPPKADN